MAAQPRECRARVIATRAPGPDVIEADLRMEDPPRLEFEAGQWLSIPLGPKSVRAYTIASTPSSPHVLTLAADVEPGGPGSVWFQGLAPGATVQFKGPLGGFRVDRADSREALFIGEEIGIVPIRSILRDLDETGAAGRANLVYWARGPDHLVYDAEFRSLARRWEAFAYHPVVGAPGPGWTDGYGAVSDVVDRLTPSVEDLVAYVAGSERLIHAVRDQLVAKGFARRAVKWEKFW